MTPVLGILRAGGDRLGVRMVEPGGTLPLGVPLVTAPAAAVPTGPTLGQTQAFN